ncbi:hypothetical protein [Vibrio vulnificus]|uniref:hypothetical protein n=1 Tax=Vibrio vulnificus TaxID=672 RepID=UPI000A3B9357|nr:hypothetical protein [Vibrio vulnificus]OUD77223.1 hypothetical protein XM73_c20575 [Vibrio vulnificus]
MSQELVNSVNKLTDETSALLQEYVKGNTVLQNSASEAASSAAAAKVSEGITIDKANVATQKAAEAKQFRDETAAVATGGTATLDPTPGKIPLANAEAKIHAGWLPVNVSSLSEAIVNAIRDVNKEQYAASGFIHTGRAYVPSNITVAINEGMWTYATPQSLLTNSFAMGNMAGSQVGTSASPYPVMNVAGFEVHLRGINTNNTAICNQINLPEAPNGTVVCDSSGNCRGSGKPTLDLSKEVDPKYGDVASSTNEAVSRAFEGAARNGDFRFGSAAAWATSGANNITISDGKAIIGASTNLYQVTSFSNGTQIVIEFYAENVTGSCRVSGNDGSDFYTMVEGLNKIIVTVEPAHGSRYLLRTAANSSVTIKNVSIRPATEEVVINRVDMAGIEFFKEKVGAYLYPYGMIQNKATADDGVATTEDTVRPITYFAVFDGDTTSRGLGWKLADLTFVQLATIMSNPEHNAWYNEAGELMQFRGRQRSFAGLGNGDWRVFNPKGDILSFGTENLTRVAAQGRLDTPASPSGGGNFFAGYTFTAHNAKPEVGMFTVSSNSGDYQAPDGECYFYVLATVPRLNQGAYHNGFNSMGTTLWRDATGNHGGGSWSSSFVGKATSVADCFFYYPSDTTPYTKAGALAYHGKIGRGSSRPDGRFYDAIYPSGQGGVIDWRLPARDMSSKEEAAKIFQKVVNGTYRGLEKLVYTRVLTSSGSGSSTAAATHAIVLDDNSNVSVGDLAFLLDWSGTSWQRCIVETVSSNGSNITVRGVTGELTRADATAGNVPIFVNESKTHISVSGDFTQLDVIGSPEEILKVDALKNGWMGSWIPKIPDGTGNYPLTKKSLVNTGRYTYTTTSGVNWVSGGQPYDTTKNITTGTSGGVGSVFLFDYTAFAKQTKPSTNKPVLNGSEGLGDVSASSWFGGSSNGMCFLTESLIGKVPTSNAGWGDIELSLKVISANIRGDNFKIQYIGRHAPVALGEPTNNSPAVKTLWYQTATNGQCNLNFAYNELKYKAGVENPWGDTVVGTTYTLPHGQMIIGDGRSTYINLNGDVCLYGAAELAIPYGYTKNKAGAGVQVAGVDL